MAPDPANSDRVVGEALTIRITDGTKSFIALDRPGLRPTAFFSRFMFATQSSVAR